MRLKDTELEMQLGSELRCLWPHRVQALTPLSILVW